MLGKFTYLLGFPVTQISYDLCPSKVIKNTTTGEFITCRGATCLDKIW